MTGRLAPTICGSTPAFGLRIRLDGPRQLPIADFDCPCGYAEGVTGEAEVRALVARFEDHTRNACPIAEVREAAALRQRRRIATAARRATKRK
ncbi:hypothetical protein AB0K09_00590 [Streptomyces sp. NPDC049577]|uniref:hypothetical protein n=1 Tax=Streptomyces sp. NPDC049577 TaxID=3155153 RepID=UPI0034328FE0